MQTEVTREVLKLFDLPAGTRAVGELVATEDASLASQARILANKLRDKFTVLFNAVATRATKRMVEQTLNYSERQTKESFTEMVGRVSLDTSSLSGRLKEVVTASINEGVGLFKTVAPTYFDDLSAGIQRAITTGAGPADIAKALKREVVRNNIKTRNWVKNVTFDQTNKFYNNTNREKMIAAGCNKFEWIHSGGSQQPRELHKKRFADGGLNRGIFSFDDLPIIGRMYGEDVRGIPGQLPYCRCTMRPVFDI